MPILNGLYIDEECHFDSERFTATPSLLVSLSLNQGVKWKTQPLQVKTQENLYLKFDTCT